MKARTLVDKLLEVGPDEIHPKVYLRQVTLLHDYHVGVDLPTPEEGYTAFVTLPLAPPRETTPGEEVDDSNALWFDQFFDALDALNKPDLVPKDDVNYIVSIVYKGPHERA